MSGLLDERFKRVPEIAAASGSQTSQAGADTSDVTDGKVSTGEKPEAGMTFRVKLAGTKTGANAAMKVHLKLGGTQVMSLTAPGATAVDWVAEFTIRYNSHKVQRVMGWLLTNAAAVVADYAAGTVDCSAGVDLVPQIESQHASDTVTCEVVTVEKWVQ